MRAIAAVLVLTVLGSACATGYTSRKDGAGAFSETQVDRNVWVVRFSGNRYTSDERATDLTLLRSAELALDNGFPYFAIIGSADESSQTSFTQVHGSGRSAWASTHTRRAPGLANTIVGLKQRPEDGSYAFDAEFIRDSMRKKYGL